VIGTLFLLAELGVVPAQDGGVHILQETGAGVLPVESRFKMAARARYHDAKGSYLQVRGNINKKSSLQPGLSSKRFRSKLQPELVSTASST